MSLHTQIVVFWVVTLKFDSEDADRMLFPNDSNHL
jgi:hypothetical protein